MTRPRRSDVFDPDSVGVYHCFNRIVRRSFLCGFDPHSGKDFSHRRDWLYQRLKYLAHYFAIDVLAYAVLSNHYHLVLRNRPDEVEAMDDSQVVTAWLMICPKSQKQENGTVGPPTEAEIQCELQRPGRVAELRGQLSNPSWLIRQLAQYMGIRCNAEDAITGHFWESRFDMTRLLDEAAVLACLAYVDLNPLRAHLVDSLEAYPHVSIGERLRSLEGGGIDPSSWLAPIALEGEADRERVTVVNRLSRAELAEAIEAEARQPLGCLPIELEQYAELLRWLAGSERRSASDAGGGEPPEGEPPEGEPPSTESPKGEPPRGYPVAGYPRILGQFGLDPSEFSELVAHFGERFYTAAGCPASLREEARRRGKRRLNGPGRHALSRSEPKGAAP